MWFKTRSIATLATKNLAFAELAAYEAKMTLHAAQADLEYWESRIQLHKAVLAAQSKPAASLGAAEEAYNAQKAEVLFKTRQAPISKASEVS